MSMPTRTFTAAPFVVIVPAAVTTARGSTRHSLSEITSGRPGHGVIRFLTGLAPRRRGPRPPPRSTGKESTPAAPIAIAAVTDERRLLMNLHGRPDPTGSISTPLRMNVAERQQHRPGRIIDGGVDQAVLAAADPLQQPLARQRVGEYHLDLGGGLLSGDDLGQPLAAHQVLDHGRGDPGAGEAGEVGRVVDPD